MTHRFCLSTTCFSALLVGSVLAQGDPNRTRPGSESENARFVDSATFRGAMVYAGKSGGAQGQTGGKEDARVGEQAGQTGAVGQAQRGEMIGSISDLIACTGKEAMGGATSGTTGANASGVPVKALLRLSGAAGGGLDKKDDAARGAAGQPVGNPGLGDVVTVELKDLHWHADGRYFTCSKSKEALRSSATGAAGAGRTDQSGAGRTDPIAGHTGGKTGSEEGVKFSELTMAQLRTSDGKTGRLSTVVIDTQSGSVPFVLASGFDTKGVADAAGDREGAAGAASGRKEDGSLVTPSGRESVVIPFGVLNIQSSSNAGDMRTGDQKTGEGRGTGNQGQGERGEQTGAGEQRKPPIAHPMGGVQITVPMPADKLASAPQLSPTQLERLDDASFRQKVESFYKGTSTTERRGD